MHLKIKVKHLFFLQNHCFLYQNPRFMKIPVTGIAWFIASWCGPTN